MLGHHLAPGDRFNVVEFNSHARALFAVPMPVDPAQIIMVWHKRSTASPGHQWLRDRIAEILQPLDDGEIPAGETS